MDPIAKYQKQVLNKLNDEGKIDLASLIVKVIGKTKCLDELTYDEASMVIIEVSICLK